MAALAMLLIAFTSPVLATFFLLGIYVAGHLATSLIEMATMLPTPWVARVLEVVFYALPRLDLFSHTLEVVHGVPIDPQQIFWATAYAVVYAAGMLLISTAIFRSRQFS
jgi:hypothetical protein